MNSQSGNGRVFCSSFDQMAYGTEAALAIDKYFDSTAERLGYRRNEPVEVWLDPEWATHGATLERCIVLNPSRHPIDFMDPILVHELVHWHAQGTALQRNLPHTILEGLAESIAVDLVPQCEKGRRTLFGGLLNASSERGDLPRLVPRLGLSQHKFVTLPGGDRLSELYALGFTLVDRIGVDALREAAERGPVSPEMILEMAGVSADGTGLVTLDANATGQVDSISPVCIETCFLGADGADIGCVTTELPDSGQVPAGAVRCEVRIVGCPEGNPR